MPATPPFPSSSAEVESGGGPLVMGVLNVTPDSFSDGGLSNTPELAIAAGRKLLADGADILDIGGESSRPGASPVTPEEEQFRVLPVIRGLAREGVRISVDTRNASTMAAALDAGASIINDISALQHDPACAGMLAGRDCGVILMHMRGTPATMGLHNVYGDVATDVTRELAARVAFAEKSGIARDRLMVDPGIGFAKGRVENLAMLRGLGSLLTLGCPIVVGVSRKRFLGAISGESDPMRRGPASIAAGLFAILQGASILRVHDVAGTVQALRVWRALLGSGMERA